MSGPCRKNLPEKIKHLNFSAMLGFSGNDAFGKLKWTSVIIAAHRAAFSGASARSTSTPAQTLSRNTTLSHLGLTRSLKTRWHSYATVWNSKQRLYTRTTRRCLGKGPVFPPHEPGLPRGLISRRIGQDLVLSGRKANQTRLGEEHCQQCCYDSTEDLRIDRGPKSRHSTSDCKPDLHKPRLKLFVSVRGVDMSRILCGRAAERREEKTLLAICDGIRHERSHSV